MIPTNKLSYFAKHIPLTFNSR